MKNGPVYVVKPKFIFKHPFNKYDLSSPTNRETQNQQLTDYFNYGFNEDTMYIYAKLIARTLKSHECRKHTDYFDKEPQLLKMNDEIPMDLGGFSQFYEPSLLNNDAIQELHNGEKLVEYFIYLVIAHRPEYPLIEFVKKMYKDEGEDIDLYRTIEQIGQNLEQKYTEVMAYMHKEKTETKANPRKGNNNAAIPAKVIEKQQSRKRKESSSEDSSSGDDSSQASHKRRDKSKSHDQHKRQKKRSKSRSKDHRKKKENKDKSKKTKKVKKDKEKSKHKKRSKSHSHSKKKKHH